jgi:hypothetical protein
MVTEGMTKSEAEKQTKRRAVRKQLLANGQSTDRGHWQARRWAACRPPKLDITTDGILQLLLSHTAVVEDPSASLLSQVPCRINDPLRPVLPPVLRCGDHSSPPGP